MTQLAWTLAAVAALGGTALADDVRADMASGEVLAVQGGASHRGVAQDYLVLPSGGELTGSIAFVTAEPSLAGAPLRFSDLALFSLAGRVSVVPRLEISGGVTLLPKQPSYTDEKVWQSASIGVRTPIGHKAAFALSGAGGHLIGHQGMWTREALAVEWRKPIAEILDFGVTGGLDGVALIAPHAKTAMVTEVGVSTTALFREPSGHWGSWIGISYAVPIASQGSDPTTGLALDPQPRLDFRVGTVLAIVPQWDLFAELAVIDRGDLASPQTRLPMLDGGFDQRQVIFGVTRHLNGSKKRPTSNYNDELSLADDRGR